MAESNGKLQDKAQHDLYVAFYFRIQDEEVRKGPVVGPVSDLHIEAEQIFRTEPFLKIGTKLRGYIHTANDRFPLSIELFDGRWWYPCEKCYKRKDLEQNPCKVCDSDGQLSYHFTKIMTSAELDQHDPEWRSRLEMPINAEKQFLLEGLSLPVV